MTREEAISVLIMLKERELYALEYIRKYSFPQRSLTIAKALDIAIESLSDETVPIQEVKLKDGFKIDDIPQDYEPAILGSVEVVRCKDCRHYSVEGETTHFGWCEYWSKPTDEMRSCSIGERREEC